MFISTDELVDHFRCGVGSDSLISDWVVKGCRRARQLSGTLGDGLRKKDKGGDTVILALYTFWPTDSITK